MTDKEFYQRLGDIWNDLNTFLRKLTIPTHSQKSITDLTEDLLRVKINHFINDWLVVAYVPDSKNVESPSLRNPSGDNEKQIYDYLNETLHILVHWWKHKKDLDQWSITASQLKPLCDELKKRCSKSNRKPIQTIGVVAGLRKIAELLKDAGVGRYTVRKAETLKWDLSAVWADISLDVINVGKGHSVSRKKKCLTHEEEDLKALVEDVMEILERIERMPPDGAVKSANKLEYLASELENITAKEPRNKTQVETSRSDLESGSPNDSQKRVRHSAQKAVIKESPTPFEQMQKILNEFIEQLKDLEWSESFTKFSKKIEADKVKIIVNDIKTEQAETIEAADREQIEAEKEIKAQERLQRECEYVRGLCELSIKHKKGSPEAIEAAKKVLELLPKIERGDYSLWREMKDTLFILSEALCADNEEAKAETDIMTLDSMRKNELICDFCNWTDKLIEYIKHPDKNREISKTRADTLGDQINILAQKIWPQTNFDLTGWPYRSTDIPENAILHSGTIFSIQPELKERIIERLKQWKDLALVDKSNLQNEMKIRMKQKTQNTIGLKVKTARDQVFISYSHKDKRWFDDLLTHLKPLVRSGSITAWSDEQIEPGSKWFSEIKAALASTKVAVLLVTPNFLASDFIHEHELTPLMKEAEKGNVRVIWIPVRACLYKETPLKDDQAAIDPAKPLANMKAERDKAWVTICEEIKRAVASE